MYLIWKTNWNSILKYLKHTANIVKTNTKTQKVESIVVKNAKGNNITYTIKKNSNNTI
jgi:hypothetical protein